MGLEEKWKGGEGRGKWVEGRGKWEGMGERDKECCCARGRV